MIALPGKPTRLEIGQTLDVGLFYLTLESVANDAGHFVVYAKDGSTPWIEDPPPRLKVLTTRPPMP